MPFSGFHSSRQSDPDQYVRLRYAKDKGGKGVSFVYGFKKGGGSEIQTIRFDKKKFTPTQARKWLKNHGFSSGQFEPASKEAMTITTEAHTPSHEEIRDLIDKALRAKYPGKDDYYSHRFLVHKVWDDRVLLCRGYYSQHMEDPNWALIDYDIDEGGDDSIPSVTLGELVPVTIQAVPKDGGDGVTIDEAGRRNANSDAAKINQAIRALLATLNDDDLEEDTINVLNAKMLAPINGEGDFQDLGEADELRCAVQKLWAKAILAGGEYLFDWDLSEVEKSMVVGTKHDNILRAVSSIVFPGYNVADIVRAFLPSTESALVKEAFSNNVAEGVLAFVEATIEKLASHDFAVSDVTALVAAKANSWPDRGKIFKLLPTDLTSGSLSRESRARRIGSVVEELARAITEFSGFKFVGPTAEDCLAALKTSFITRNHNTKHYISEAKWSQAFINDLDDDAFALVRSGKKDDENKTVPRTNRFLPYKDAQGKVDLPHLRNALARLPQTDLSDEEKTKARRILQAAAKRAGVGASSKESTDHQGKDMITEAWSSLPGETFTEAFGSALSEAEIDYENLILKNVVVLGPTSTNGRKYPVETQKSALSLFEGIRAYVNHPKLNEMSEPRDMRDLIGEHKNLRMVGDKTVSDLYLIDNAVVRDVVLPLAESKPHLAGNSIVARGKMVKEKDGTHKVEQILAARSIDIVTEPATTNSLFTEGKQFSSEEEEMDLKTLTMETLKKDRPDLFEAVTTALQAEIESKTQREAESKALKDKVTALESRVTELEASIVGRDKKIVTYELEAAKAQKDSLIEGIFKAAKIPDRAKYTEKDGVRAINPHFRSLLERCQDEPEMKELVRTWEETYRQGPISEEKRLDFGENGKVSEAALDRLYKAVG